MLSNFEENMKLMMSIGYDGLFQSQNDFDFSLNSIVFFVTFGRKKV